MVTVYHAPNTRSLRVLWTLEELGAPYEVVSVAFPPRQRQPDYLAVNPSGSLPAMVDGPLTLTESLAICEYLDEKHSGGLAIAPGDPARADYLQWLYFGEASLSQPLGTLVRLRRLQSGSPEGLAPVADQARDTYGYRLAALEARLAGREYLAADRFTLADISNAYALNLADLIGVGEASGPNVSSWWERLQARPALQRAKAVS